ncbi:unnamed protein product [Calypogeia fissa]
MMMTMMMQAFPRPQPPLVPACRCCCCCKLEIADYTLPSLHHQNQCRGTSQVDVCDAQHGAQNIIGSMSREARKGKSQVLRSSGAGDQINPLSTGGHTLATTTTSVCNSEMGCHDHQEERVSASPLFRSSILDCNSSSSAAADVLCNDLNPGLRGNDVNAAETTTLRARSQNWNNKNSTSSSVVSPLEIECFNEADISAACLLLELSSSSSSTAPSHSGNDAAAAVADEECSSAGCPRATDDEIGRTVQERKATWDGEATYSSSGTPRSLRIELRTLGKKRVKPRKDERDLVFGMNQEDLTTDHNKFDMDLDRPTRKRNYKSLRELLGVTNSY